MLIQYNSCFKLVILKRLAKLKKYTGIKNKSKLNKNDIINNINKINAIIFIQRKIRHLFNNEETCPITLCKLNYPVVAVKNNLISKNSVIKFRYYSFFEFLNYLNSLNDNFTDPITREELNDKTLNQINTLIKHYKVKDQKLKKKWNKNLKKRNEFYFLYNCINDVISQIFSTDILTIDYIYGIIIPQFIYYFHFMLLNFKNKCLTLVNNYLTCINFHTHSNKDIILDFLTFIKTINNL